MKKSSHLQLHVSARRTSFVVGASLGNSLSRFTDRVLETSDSHALQSDWVAVGADLQDALDELY